jgi:hypothetical protein
VEFTAVLMKLHFGVTSVFLSDLRLHVHTAAIIVGIIDVYCTVQMETVARRNVS